MQPINNEEEMEFMTSVYETTIQELAEEVQKWKKHYSQAVYAMREEKEELTDIVREQKQEIHDLIELVQKMSTEIQQLRLRNMQENQTIDDSAFQMQV